MEIPEKEDEGPDVKVLLDEPGSKDILDGSAEGQEGGNPMDSRWNNRMKEKLELMKSKKLRDMSITISQKTGDPGGLIGSRQRRTQLSMDERVKMNASGRIRQELTERQGTIEFLTGDTDGAVDICVQSISAHMSSPSRFVLNVTVEQTMEPEEEEDGADPLEANAVKLHMSRLERDIQNLGNRMSTILTNADTNKDQEVKFHAQSVAMNRAATYWPVIRLIVLVVTGVTQANQIVRYMKTHHIGV
jgi:hypothetical protein